MDEYVIRPCTEKIFCSKIEKVALILFSFLMVISHSLDPHSPFLKGEVNFDYLPQREGSKKN